MTLWTGDELSESAARLNFLVKHLHHDAMMLLHGYTVQQNQHQQDHPLQ
jgi:hypothetical protein